MTNINPKPNDEIGIKLIAEALREGGTLLGAACPICSYPLIKVQDKIYCKVCNNEVIIYRDERELPKEYQQLLIKKSLPIKVKDTPMIKTLKEKIERLRIKLEATDDPNEIIKITEAIDKLHMALEKIRNG